MVGLYKRGIAFLAVLSVCSWGTGVFAEVQSEVGQLFREARFDETEAWCNRVIGDSSSTARQLAEAHLYQAALRLMEDDEARAEHHVRIWAALDADLELPPGLPLRLEELRDAAQQELPVGGMTISVDAPECIVVAANVSLSIAVDGAPEGLVSTIALECGAATNPWRTEQPLQGPIQIEIPQGEGLVGEALACAVLALGSSGATLRRQNVEVHTCEEAETPPAVQEDTPHRDEFMIGQPVSDSPQVRRSPWGWVGLALGSAVVVATAVTLGVVFGTRPDDAIIGPVELETQP